MAVNARTEKFQHIEVFDKPALFTNGRIARDTVPKGWYCYDIRGSDDDPGELCYMEENVVVNHAGSVLMPEKLAMPKSGRLDVRDELGFLDEGNMTLREFCEAHQLPCPAENMKFHIRPARPEEAGLFYIKSGKASGYMRYIATREGVEKLAGNGAVTKGQRELIQKLLHDFPDAVELFEYEDYCKTPTLGTASAFITMALDANLHEIDSESGYMQYIATRPRVQKRGAHGLFSSATAVDLASAMSELEAHEGNVWTIIYSLRREDAARLEYDSADAWRTLLMENAPALAKSMKISLNNFHWYAAFHDEGHHPHIHMMVWSDNPKEGFLTKDGIATMRSKLTNAIFRDEMQQIYERKDVAYSDLVEAAQNAMREMISRMQHQICDSPIIEDNMRQLVQALETTTGKRQYGYLKKPLKQFVDTIVDALAELPEASECYEVWNQIHEELNECYGHSTPWERLPLSQRKEFRKIKNDIIREAENIRLGLPTFEDERMQDEPEPESQKEEHQSYSVYEQAQRYRTAKAVLQDIYALDAEHADAVKALEQLWEEGYTVVAHQLGKFYRDDLSTLRDHEKAEQWFRCSAEAGNDFSEYALGKLLLTQKRTVEALEWLDKAAEQGNQFARYRLGKIYLTGEPVSKDVEKALAYLTASADQGNQFAQYALGKLYLFGRDVPPDREQAREWLIRAAAQGNEYARFFLDRFDQFRDPSVMLAATKLLHHMSRIFQSNSVPPSNPAGIRIDSKRRRRLMEKRMAMGHRADDHEEQTQYQQSM